MSDERVEHKRIWKYKFKTDDTFTIEMPQWHNILTIEKQEGEPCIWVEVDTSSPVREYSFAIYGTGHPLPKNPGTYVGTYQDYNGGLVWHVYQTNSGRSTGCPVA